MNNRTINRVLAVAGIVVGAIYLVNPGAGMIELIADIIPIVGNLDEAGATALLLWGVQTLRQPAETLALPPVGRRPPEQRQ